MQSAAAAARAAAISALGSSGAANVGSMSGASGEVEADLIDCMMCVENKPAFVHDVAGCGRTECCKDCAREWFEGNLLVPGSQPTCPSCQTPVRYKELRQCSVSSTYLENFSSGNDSPAGGAGEGSASAPRRSSVGMLAQVVAGPNSGGGAPSMGAATQVVNCAECGIDVPVYEGHADGYVRCPDPQCGQLTCIEHKRRLVRYSQADADRLGEDVIASVVARVERAATPSMAFAGGGLGGVQPWSGATMSRHSLCPDCVAVATNPNVSRVRRFIEEEVLNLLCPACRRPIVIPDDFDDCLALHCDPHGPCKARPCAWCFEDVGHGERTDASNQAAHEHCRTCPHAPEPEREFVPGDGVRGGGLYCRAVPHEAPHVKQYLDEHWRGKKQARALAVLGELAAGERAQVIEKLRAQLSELGISE